MDLRAAFVQLATSSPAILVAALAIVVAIFRYRRHPGASVLTILAFVSHLAGIALSAGYQGWLLGRVADGVAASEVTTYTLVYSVAGQTLNLMFLILITVAVFVGRRPAREGAVP